MLRTFGIVVASFALLGTFMAVDRTVGHWYVSECADEARTETMEVAGRRFVAPGYSPLPFTAERCDWVEEQMVTLDLSGANTAAAFYRGILEMYCPPWWPG